VRRLSLGETPEAKEAEANERLGRAEAEATARRERLHAARQRVAAPPRRGDAGRGSVGAGGTARHGSRQRGPEGAARCSGRVGDGEAEALRMTPPTRARVISVSGLKILSAARRRVAQTKPMESPVVLLGHGRRES
jgi:hypothetical protein